MRNEEQLPPREWLEHLHMVEQWERLEKFATEVLTVDAEDMEAHFHRAWALLKIERGKEAGAHVEYLLGVDSEEVSFLKLAAFWHMYAHKRYTQARSCLAAALAIDPEDASLWYLAAIVETQLHQFDSARRYITHARELNPDDADIAFLHISLLSMEQTGAKAAWQTVRQHEKALALDAENDSLIASMGDVYLDELEMPERAEELYRQALAIDPSDRHHHQRLWKVMQQRNLLFRTLRLPFSGMTFGLNLLRAVAIKPWLILCYLVGFKLILAYLVWLLAATVVFGPPALIAGWLVVRSAACQPCGRQSRPLVAGLSSAAHVAAPADLRRAHDGVLVGSVRRVRGSCRLGVHRHRHLFWGPFHHHGRARRDAKKRHTYSGCCAEETATPAAAPTTGEPTAPATTAARGAVMASGSIKPPLVPQSLHDTRG